jgi:hypothetical protein
MTEIKPSQLWKSKRPIWISPSVTSECVMIKSTSKFEELYTVVTFFSFASKTDFHMELEEFRESYEIVK